MHEPQEGRKFKTKDKHRHGYGPGYPAEDSESRLPADPDRPNPQKHIAHEQHPTEYLLGKQNRPLRRLMGQDNHLPNREEEAQATEETLQSFSGLARSCNTMKRTS